MLCREDGRRGHHHELDVGDGHARPLRLLLRVLQHDDVLGDSVGLAVVLMHVGAEGDHVDGMQPPAVGVEEGDDLEGRHLRVEGVGVLEVVVPDLVDDFPQDLGGPAFGRLETGVVVEAGFVGHLRANANDRGGIVLDASVVEREADRASERVAAMVGSVPHTIGDDGSEGVDAPELIVGDLHEDGEQRLPDRQEIVVRGLSLEGRKSIAGLFEEERDRVGRHANNLIVALSGFLRGRTGAVKDRDDDDQRECVGSGELGEIGAFRDSAESVGSGDGNGGLRGFFSIKLELDFHCRGRWVGRLRRYNLGMKKSSIGGNRYLDYLWELGELPVYIYWWCWRFAAPDSLRSVHSENQGFFTPLRQHPRCGKIR